MSKVEVDTIDTTSSGSGTLTIGSSNSTTITTAKTVTGNFKDIQWQSVITADGSTNTTAEAGKGYFIDTTSAVHTINLPASPSAGDTVAIVDAANTFSTNSVTVGRNGSNIESSASDDTITAFGANRTYVYVNSTIGWKKVNSDGTEPLYVSATGGTESTSGNYKIHTFNSSSTLVVSCAGNSAGSAELEYIVVAGGGAGGNNGGGGGAGGFRFASPSLAPESYPGKPLVAPTAITAIAQTYPVTVGGGGSGSPYSSSTNCAGSNSVFSTITSAGGGQGGTNSNGTPSNDVGNGGSGGGGSYLHPGGSKNGGSGNTPPVSPSQGNNGGNTSVTGPFPAISPDAPAAGSGGGGAMAAGGSVSSPSITTGGVGGVGAGIPTAFGSNGESSGGYRYYAGGGGGAAQTSEPTDRGVGGLGGGGASGLQEGTASNATANTGGGGGGSAGGSGVSGNGGSGVVIIRYKYQ